MAAKSTRERQQARGPAVWWARNDLRVEDNPVLRMAAAEAALDGRSFSAVFIFDPRFLDRSNYGRVTDPSFEKSISKRRDIDFGNRKCSAQRAHFYLQCVRSLSKQLQDRGVDLKVCHGLPEEIFAALPSESSVFCQQEAVSVECTDVEKNLENVLSGNGSSLVCEWGAMSLYHRDDLPFYLEEEYIPKSYSALGVAVGWKDIWCTPDREKWASRVREPVAAPSVLPARSVEVEFPGLISEEELDDDEKSLARLGYSPEEIADALAREDPQGGEANARRTFEVWLSKQDGDGGNPQHGDAVFWDLPVGHGPGQGHDALQWANLARPDGWLRMSQYLAVGCISAREIYARSLACQNFNGVVHRLMWREWHRLCAIRFGRRFFWLQGPGWVERPWVWRGPEVEAWKEGKTGIPYVDACMRELRQTGWLAYKGRKTTAFFLVFGLGADWRIGAYLFEELLLDYDCAMNYGNWITVAAVEKPNRRGWHTDDKVEDIIEAYRQDIEVKLSAEMANDPSGEYIKRWVPELRSVDAAFVHKPWAMSEEDMEKCGCVVGKTYPAPLMSNLTLSTEVGEGGVGRSMERLMMEDDGEERRVHPEDFKGQVYTKKEFIEYGTSLGKSESWGEELWAGAAVAEGKPAADPALAAAAASAAAA
mmetsp:Transcript_47006/g.134494  ORF Transcript_47006/g.134494 Transcript_47006/m.134494 type:complete len:650 (+) Transcript_47006:86-2035(+)